MKIDKKIIRSIVFINYCLVNSPVDIKISQAILSNTIFEVIIRILYDSQLKQVMKKKTIYLFPSHGPNKNK